MYKNKNPIIKSTISISLLCTLFSVQAIAEDWLVDSPKAYTKVAPNLQPGDNVILADGTWNNFEILFKGEGTKQKPITLKAQTKGKVF